MTIWCQGLRAEWNVNNEAKIFRILKLPLPDVKRENVEWNLY